MSKSRTHFLVLILAGLTAVPLLAQGTLLDQGRAAMSRNDAQQAADLFEKAAAANPKSAEAHYWLGSAYGSLAQEANPFKQAMLASKTKTEFEAAVALDPNLLDARSALMQFYAIAPGFMGGSYDKAFEQANEIRKRDVLRGHRAFSFLYTTQKKPDLARKEYVDSVREQPASAKAHYYYGVYLMNVEKSFKAANDELQTSVRLDPTYMPGWYQIGHVAALSGANLAGGEEALRKYTGYTPQHDEPTLARAHYWLGTVYEKEGKKADARASYAASLKLNPSQKDTAEALKRVS